MKTIYSVFLIYIFSVGLLFANNPSDGKRTLQGTVTDKISGDNLIGVSVYFPDLKKGSVTDINGNYSISDLPNIQTPIQVTYVGHRPILENIDLSTTKVKDFMMEESDARINEVIVTALTGSALIERTPTPITLVPKTELLQQASSNIIDAIAKQPGISQITTGSGISKPVIRGLGYNRVVVVNDGIRQEGQQWGDEHGVEIDGQSVNSVEILKGPASLMYGSDAMAGVINFLPAPILPEGSISSSLYSEYQTNNGLYNFSVNTQGNQKGILWNLRYSDKRAHSYKNKYDDYVFNSGFKEKAFTGLLGLNKSWGYSHLTFSYYQMTPGIIEGERDDATGKFIKEVAIDGKIEDELATNKDGRAYKHFVPYQQIKHYKVVLNNNFILGKGNLKTLFGYQQNRRQEFEDVLDPNEYSLYFQLHTFNYDVRYLLPEINGYKIVTGVNGMYQSSLNKGSETLLPEYNVFDFGVFGIASKNFGKLDVSGGFRYDYRHQNIKEFEPHDHDHDHDHDSGDHDEDDDHDHDHEAHVHPGYTKNYNGISASLGASYQISDNWYAKANLSRGFRSPNINELAAHGAHGGAIRYELGNPNLKAENSWQLDLGFGYSSPIVSVDLSLFGNRINNYIFSTKMVNADGSDLITDGYKTYQYVSGDARLLGGEINVDFHPIERIHFMNSFSYVNSVQLHQSDSTKYLPFTPAPKWSSDLRFDLTRHAKTFNNMYVSVGIDLNFKQNHVYSANGTETPTPSYTLLNAGFGTDLVFKGKTWASVYITGNNLFDKAYQSSMSRLKYADKNLVTGRTGVYNMGRNFGFKVLIPLDF